MRKYATKTSTLRTMRSVNDAMRLAISCVEQSTKGELSDDGQNYLSRPLTAAERAELAESAIRWLSTARDRLEHAMNHAASYAAKQHAAAEYEGRAA